LCLLNSLSRCIYSMYAMRVWKREFGSYVTILKTYITVVGGFYKGILGYIVVCVRLVTVNLSIAYSNWQAGVVFSGFGAYFTGIFRGSDS
jgi:hypothetical protein